MLFQDYAFVVIVVFNRESYWKNSVPCYNSVLINSVPLYKDMGLLFTNQNVTPCHHLICYLLYFT